MVFIGAAMTPVRARAGGAEPISNAPPVMIQSAGAEAPVVTTNSIITTTNIQSQNPNMPAFTAEDFRTTWQIPPPDDKEFDWIQLKSGEWLKGELKSLQGDKLSFDSDELDELEFKWKDVYKLISPRTNSVVIDDGEKREEVLGSLWITQDKVIVDGKDTVSYPRKDLFGIVPGTPKEINYWGGKIALGLTLRGGNTDQIEYNARLNLYRRTPSTALQFDYLGNFSETDGTETANNQRATATFDIFVSRFLFIRIPFLEYYHDPFQNIDHRFTAGAGVGYDIFNRFNSPVIEWNVVIGPAYQHTWYSSVEAGQSSNEGGAAFVAGTRFNWDVTSRIEFTLDSKAQIAAANANSTTWHNEFIWEIELTKRLDVSFVVDYTADPKPDSTGTVPEKSDYRLTLALGLDL